MNKTPTAYELRNHLRDEHGLITSGRDYSTLMYLHLTEHDCDPDVNHVHEERTDAE